MCSYACVFVRLWLSGKVKHKQRKIPKVIWRILTLKITKLIFAQMFGNSHFYAWFLSNFFFQLRYMTGLSGVVESEVAVIKHQTHQDKFAAKWMMRQPNRRRRRFFVKCTFRLHTVKASWADENFAWTFHRFDDAKKFFKFSPVFISHKASNSRFSELRCSFASISSRLKKLFFLLNLEEAKNSTESSLERCSQANWL